MAVVDSTVVIREVLRDQPAVVEQLDAAHDAAWAAVPADVLELCRLRVAQLLGCSAELAQRTEGCGVVEATIAELPLWPTSSRFSARERACLAFCEQFVIDVATLDDSLAAAATDQLGAQGFVDFVSGLLVIEQRQRLRLGWAALFGEVSGIGEASGESHAKGDRNGS